MSRLATLRQRYRTSPWARAVYDPVMLGYYWIYLGTRIAGAFLDAPLAAWRAARLRNRQARWRAAGGDWFSYQGRIYWLRADGSLDSVE